jgi:DNA-binding NtrC family response regulator
MTEHLTEQRTVLVVDDDRMVGQIVSISLEKGNYRVLLAGSGAEATEIARRCPNGIDVIVTDVFLGHEKGPAIAALVREYSPNAQLLLISGYPLEVLFEKNLLHSQCVDDRQTAFLQKPFLSKTIIQAVNDMLTARSEESDLHAAAAH